MSSSLPLKGGALSQRNLKEEIYQQQHGFSAGTVVRFEELHLGTQTGADPLIRYVKAQADSPKNAEVVGVVTANLSSDYFMLAYAGSITISEETDTNFAELNQSLQPVFFLSGETAGMLTDTPPSKVGSVVKPVLTKNYNNNSYLIINQLGVQIGGSSTVAIDEIQPVGTISSFSGPSVPDTWLSCDGNTFDINEYSELYEAVLHSSEDRAPIYGHIAQLTTSTNLLIGNTLSQGTAPNIIRGVVLMATSAVSHVLILPQYDIPPNNPQRFSYPNKIFKSGTCSLGDAGTPIQITNAFVKYSRTPDLRGRFVMGTNPTIPSNWNSSTESISNTGNFGGSDSTILSAVSVGLTGSVNNVLGVSPDHPDYNNLPPYTTTYFIIKAKPYTRAAIIGGVDIPYDHLLVRDLRTRKIGGVDSDLGLYTNTSLDGGLGTLRMKIEGANGNIGIATGTGTISAKLHIKGPTFGSGIALKVEDDLVLSNGGSIFFGGTYNYSTGNYIRPLVPQSQYFNTNGTERMRITPSGNIVIGGVTPASGALSWLFEVGGPSIPDQREAKFWGNVSIKDAIRRDHAASFGQLEDLPDSDWSAQVVGGDQVTTAVKVGVGFLVQETPQTGFSVKGIVGPRSETRLICLTPGGSSRISWWGLQPSDATTSTPSSSWALEAYTNGNFAIRNEYGDQNTDKFIINNLGNIGIGNSNPIARLDILNNVPSNNAFRLGSSSSNTLTIGNSANDTIGIGNNITFNSTSGSWSYTASQKRASLFQFDDGGFQFWGTNSINSVAGSSVSLVKIMHINNNGYVGIGVVNPDNARLQVAGNVVAHNPRQGEPGRFDLATRNYVDTFQDTAWIGEATESLVYVNPNVSVGIGTQNPLATLHVIGTTILGSDSSETISCIGKVLSKAGIENIGDIITSGKVRSSPTNADDGDNTLTTKSYVDTFKETSWIGGPTSPTVFVESQVRVGIGVAVPSDSCRLEIAGNIKFAGATYGILTPIIPTKPTPIFGDLTKSPIGIPSSSSNTVINYDLFSGLAFQSASSVDRSQTKNLNLSAIPNTSNQLLIMDRGYARTVIGEGIWTGGVITCRKGIRANVKSFRLNSNTLSNISSDFLPIGYDPDGGDDSGGNNSANSQGVGQANFVETSMAWVSPAPIIGVPPQNISGFAIGQVWYEV